LLINLFIGYIFFEQRILKKSKIIIVIGSILLLFLILSFTLDITKSRFDGDEKSSVLYYFGHSMLIFDYGITDTISKYLNGDYFMGSNEKLYIHGFDSVIGTHFETNFFTFAGGWYLDFGPLGTLIIAICLPFIISQSFRNKCRIDMADLYLYFFYLSFLINGVFVHGIGNIIMWIMAISLYTVFKIVKI
jgi:oligosaccharide repeat unit polymerase